LKKFLFLVTAAILNGGRGTGKPQSEKEHTIQWLKVDDTQRVNHKERKNIQCNGQQLMMWFTRWVSSTVGHCTVCSFSLCGLPVGYHQLLAIVLYVLSRFVVYPLGIINCWPERTYSTMAKS
jgi:hypothetical protein